MREHHENGSIMNYTPTFDNSNGLIIPHIVQATAALPEEIINCNVPTESGPSIIHVDRQDRNVYDYHNVTRLAAIFNNIMSKVDIHTSVDEIFSKFMLHQPNQLIKNFITNFEEYFEKYICCRYSSITNVVFHDISSPLMPNTPIHCWYYNSVLFVTYTTSYLDDLLQTVSSLLFAYGEENILDDTNMNCNNMSYTAQMNKTIDMINARVVPPAKNLKKENLSYYQFNEIKKAGVCVTDVRQIFDAVKANEANGTVTRNTPYILTNVLGIQKNIKDVYCRANFSSLLYLYSVYYVLDAVTRSITTKIILGEDSKKEQPRTNIRVNFKSIPTSKFGFMHNDVKLK